jgi:hypothetical protein
VLAFRFPGLLFETANGNARDSVQTSAHLAKAQREYEYDDMRSPNTVRRYHNITGFFSTRLIYPDGVMTRQANIADNTYQAIFFGWSAEI